VPDGKRWFRILPPEVTVALGPFTELVVVGDVVRGRLEAGTRIRPTNGVDGFTHGRRRAGARRHRNVAALGVAVHRQPSSTSSTARSKKSPVSGGA
jgi:hypothetical protein